MNEYFSKFCQYCKTEIKEGDEVKVCPECGIPHHATCWEENEGCSTFGCKEQHYEEQHTDPTDVCSNCGAPLGNGQAFCSKCGTPKNATKKNACGKCGAELQDGQKFCPECGQKVGLAVDVGTSSAISQFNSGVQKNKNRKKIALPIIVGVVAIAVIALVLLFREPSVDKITLSKSSVKLKIYNSTAVSYTIAPEKSKDAKVTWKSSNESVATVSDSGEITAKGDGSCTITVSAGGKSDSLTVIVKSRPDFKSIYNACCSSTYATVGADGSYLSIDTNPYDIDDYTVSGSIQAIVFVNTALGLPDYVLDDMSSTTALMGRQTATFDDVTVSWSYHPDKGLEVIYKAN